MRECDDLLIDKFKEGDYPAFEKLVTRYEKKIYNHALCMLSDAAEAEEVLQDTFLSAFKKIDQYGSDGGFSKWLFKIATNNCLMSLKKKKRAQFTISLDEPLPLKDGSVKMELVDLSSRPDEYLIDDEVRALVRKAVSELPEEYRSVLLLHDVEGFQNPEIAQILGLSLPAVKSRLHRARPIIKRKLCKYLKNLEDAKVPMDV